MVRFGRANYPISEQAGVFIASENHAYAEGYDHGEQ